MISKAFISILIVIVGLFIGASGQTPVSMEKIDEFGRLPCDDFLARTDNFLLRLNNDPSATGYAVTSGFGENPMNKIAYEVWLNGALNVRGLDPARIVQVRGLEAGEIKTTFWLVAAGAEKPNFEEAKWNFALPEGTKPFIVHDDMEQICSSKGYEKIIVEFLEANPSSRSNIVIPAKTLKRFEKEKKDILGMFPTEVHKRLKFFYTKDEFNARQFWIVPRSKR